MSKKVSSLKVWQLVLGLILVVGGTTTFVVLVSGAFQNTGFVIDAEYRCEGKCDGEYMELDSSSYDKLVAEKKSFVVFVDQGGCTTADKLREYVRKYAVSHGVKVYKMMFEEMKKTSLHDEIKYYPSVAVISRGKVVGYLRADADEDADAYNSYEAFEKWIEKFSK